MMIFRISSFVFVVATGACSAAPTGYPPSVASPAVHEASERPPHDLSSAEPWSINYARKIGDKYREVSIYRGSRHIRSLDDEYGAYEKELPPFTSGSGNIVLLHQIDSGLVETPKGESSRHERYYCTFVDLTDGCVLERRTGDFCSGNWASNNQWVDFDSRLTDMEKERITAESVLELDSIPADGVVWNYENLLHCDHIDAGNKSSYSKILKGNIFSLPLDQLQDAQRALEAVGR